MFVSHDSYYEHDSDQTYRYSESIDFNQGDVGGTAYFESEVDNSVGTIRMHGHRDNPFDLAAQMSLALFEQLTAGTNQYLFIFRNQTMNLVTGKLNML